MTNYEVSVIDLISYEIQQCLFTDGKYNVIIKKVDKAGKANDAGERFHIMIPTVGWYVF